MRHVASEERRPARSSETERAANAGVYWPAGEGRQSGSGTFGALTSDESGPRSPGHSSAFSRTLARISWAQTPLV